MKKFIIICICCLVAGCNGKQDDTSLISTAIPYLGYAERTHRNELQELTGVDPVRTEWCAAFINSVLEESGIEGSASVSNYPLTARSFLKWGVDVDSKDIAIGDIVVFPRGNQGWQGHVGIYFKTVVVNDVEWYYILGGNQQNKVSVVLYRASKAIGIRRHEEPTEAYGGSLPNWMAKY